MSSVIGHRHRSRHRWGRLVFCFSVAALGSARFPAALSLGPAGARRERGAAGGLHGAPVNISITFYRGEGRGEGMRRMREMERGASVAITLSLSLSLSPSPSPSRSLLLPREPPRPGPGEGVNPYRKGKKGGWKRKRSRPPCALKCLERGRRALLKLRGCFGRGAIKLPKPCLPFPKPCPPFRDLWPAVLPRTANQLEQYPEQFACWPSVLGPLRALGWPHPFSCLGYLCFLLTSSRMVRCPRPAAANSGSRGAARRAAGLPRDAGRGCRAHGLPRDAGLAMKHGRRWRPGCDGPPCGLFGR